MNKINNNIIKSKDMDMFLNMKAYCDNIIHQYDSKLAKLDNDYVNRNKLLNIKYNKFFLQDIERYKKTIEKNIQNHIDIVTKTIFEKFNQILDELLLEKLDFNYIQSIVENEIKSSFVTKKIIIYTNQKNLRKLHEALSHYSMNIEYINDKKLSINECLLETEFYKVKINIDDIKKCIKTFVYR